MHTLSFQETNYHKQRLCHEIFQSLDFAVTAINIQLAQNKKITKFLHNI